MSAHSQTYCAHCELPTTPTRDGRRSVLCPECQIEAAALVQADREDISPDDLEAMMVPVTINEGSRDV